MTFDAGCVREKSPWWGVKHDCSPETGKEMGVCVQMAW